MSRADPLPRLAVLIDAENVSPRIAGRLLEEIATLGEASVRRIYGDFSAEQLKGWAQILADHAIISQQNFALTVGKNGSDIALVIDAMDLLHSGRLTASASSRQTAISQDSPPASVSTASTCSVLARQRRQRVSAKLASALSLQRTCFPSLNLQRQSLAQSRHLAQRPQLLPLPASPARPQR